MAKEFQIEAEQLTKIKHANIITMYGHTILEDNYIIVMEYAEGGTLAAGKLVGCLQILDFLFV